MNNNPVTLLMTATITPPPNCPDLKRIDPTLRYHDYFNALKFYLQIPSKYINKIVFAENSDTDLTDLKKVLEFNVENKKVEFLSFLNGNKFPPEYGKGYGEMLLLDYAISNSSIIHTQDIIWKATGRLILDNISALIKKTPQNYDLYCDLHNDFKFLGLVHFFDPRFYSFTKKGYDKYLGPHTPNLKGKHIEHYFYNVIHEHIADEKIIPRFLQTPLIKGVVGSSNDNYWGGIKQIKRKIQQLFRILLPWMWL